MNLARARKIIFEAIQKNADYLNLNSIGDSTVLDSKSLAILLPYIHKLKSLTDLDLSYNGITDASFLKELKSLTRLDLNNNQISDISFLKELKLLTNIDLGWNKIKDASSLQELKSLIKLDLKSNQIEDFSFLKQLEFLRSLNLSFTKVSDVSFVKELKYLITLDLQSNPQLNLPENFNKNSRFYGYEIKELQKYYEQLEKEGEDNIYEAKVLIVGEPNAGKTTLFRKLQDFDYLPQNATKEEKEQTVGVNIEILEFPFDEEKDFKAHLWDFGGHEKQYVLHQYFFTERSLYVLLAHDRKEDANFNYWFEIIATLGNNCPVLVVLNEIESKVPNIDISLYRKEFGEKIKDIEEKRVDFDNNNDGRFTNLVNEIKTKLRNLEHIGKTLPKTWVKIREELGKIDKPMISLDDYYEICRECGVERADYRTQILEYLHDLGIALNYKNDDNLRNKLILKPNWVIDAMYGVLKDERIIRNAGKFSADEVFDLWNDYNSDEKTILLQLMQKGKFEVAYKLEGKNAYIAPILLPEIAPEYPFNETDSLQIHFEYTFKPKGIISRLIVRFHENIVVNKEAGEQIVWKKGVLLKHNNSFAQVIESEQRRKITITVSGKSAFENREFITIISNEVKRIHRDWFEDRLQFEEKIPCYCEVCKAETEPQFYELETVKSYYEANEPLTCDKSVKARRLQRVNPQRLLEGVYIEETKKEFREFDRNTFNIANLNMGENIINSIGDNPTFLQNLKDSQITVQKQIIDEISPKMNESQRQTMERLADEIISRIETQVSGGKKDELEEAKKGKWETKIKFTLPFIPLEITRAIPPDEFVSKVRDWLYGGDLQTNLLAAEDEPKGLLGD